MDVPPRCTATDAMLEPMAPTLGIAVVHYRTPEVALDCLVRLRSAAPEAELVLVDAAPCAAFEARLEAELPGVLFLPVPNHSYARSVNIGVAALKTDYVALMNADVLVEEETLDLLLAALEDPDADVRRGDTILWGGEEWEIDGDIGRYRSPFGPLVDGVQAALKRGEG